MPGDHLDLSSDPRPEDESRPRERRRFVGIHFACCGVYAQLPLNREGTAYQGYCPRCMKRAEIKIGPDGSSSRFFTAY